jgi:hypothetical protein
MYWSAVMLDLVLHYRPDAIEVAAGVIRGIIILIIVLSRRRRAGWSRGA